MANRLFETHKNSVILYGCHSYQIEHGRAITTICLYPLYQHALPHWNYVLIGIAILCDNSGKTHVEMFEISNIYFPHFPRIKLAMLVSQNI